MKIKSIDIRNLYSFGNSGTKELSEFRMFNLFIGKNGTGKSSVFYALKDIPLEIAYNPYSIHLPTDIYNKSIHKSKGPATAQQDRHNDRDLHIELDNDNIVFRNGKHESGDIASLQKKVKIIHSCNLFDNLLTKLRILGNGHSEKEALLTFAYKYIFNKTVRIKDASISEDYQLPEDGDHRTGNSVFADHPLIPSQREYTVCQWSSGYIFVANLISDILLAGEIEAICIEEPEQYIEPRVLRRLISFIFWLCLIQKKSRVYESPLLNSLDTQWEKWFDKNKQMFRIEKASFDYPSYSPKQIFICSHSASLINEFLCNPDYCAIYEFDRAEEENRYFYPNSCDPKDEQTRYPMVSTVKRVAELPHSILDNIGAKGSDLLQANGIIWVEGPSDVLYLRKWLEMYALENNKKILQQGIDFEFQMYGGTLLDSISYIKSGETTQEEEFKKIISMFSFSRNTFVVMDSDAIKKDTGIIDQSTFRKAKQYIKEQFLILKNTGYKLGLWYNEGDAEIRTIEDYLDDETLKNLPDSLRKKVRAIRAINMWNKKEVKLADFKHNLGVEIKELYNLIDEWNCNM